MKCLKSLFFAFGLLATAFAGGCGDRALPPNNGSDCGCLTDGPQPVDAGYAEGSVPDSTADSLADVLFWPDTALGSTCGENDPCAPGSVCIYPCCGGAPVQCEPKTDAGVCPPGTSEGCEFGEFPDGCQRDPCTPPPPYCGKADALPPGCELMRSANEAYCVCG
jgi:hypothetical protein